MIAVSNTRQHSTPAETPCAHCGLPVGRRPVGEGPLFCCTGCEVVYRTLHSTGMGETYYRLRGVAAEPEKARPADTAVDALVLSEMDSEAFGQAHTQEVAPGVRAVELFLDGVHCAACVWLVERLPYVMAGVREARLDLPRARLSLQWAPEEVRLSEVARWLARFGYAAHPVRQQEVARRTEAERRLLIKVGVAWALAGNVMLLAFALYSGLDAASDPTLATAARWMSLLLALPSVLYGGRVFFQRAWASLRLSVRTRQLRSLHMDTPIALGILVGTVDSVWATWTGRGEVWFDSITVLIAALLTARWLQLRSRRLAGDATERLLALIPSMARKVTGGPAEAGPTDRQGATLETVRIETLQPGDLVEVPAGEVFPVDGTVVAGETAVNNAVLTGESRPEPARVGAAVTAGATNLQSPVWVRVEAAGEATRVGRLLAWVRDAAGRRAQVVLLADRLSGYFVLTVVAVALLTAVLWLAVAPSEAALHVVALLVITCPCALGMATPLAMTVAAGKAARAGIFIKSDEATQLLAGVDTLVLDKTGTLTEGVMTLADYEGDEAAVTLAAALEMQSNHPIALALVQARGACTLTGEAGLPAVEAFEAVAGQGIRGRVADHEVAVGRPAWVGTLTGGLPAPLQHRLHRYAAQGYTPVAVAVDGRAAAALAVGDRVRAEAGALIGAWQAEGKAVYLLSGDHPEVVRAVAETLGLPLAHARGSVSPEGKQRFIAQLRQAGGRTVAMVGDGVNDAAALQAADVGIAVHGGSTASLVAADVFLTRAGLEPVAELLVGARRVMRVIRRNLGLSLIYNLLGATAAVAGLVSPLVAAVAMPVSSLLVVTSSITQRSFGRAAGAVPAARPEPAGPLRTEPVNQPVAVS